MILDVTKSIFYYMYIMLKQSFYLVVLRFVLRRSWITLRQSVCPSVRTSVHLSLDREPIFLGILNPILIDQMETSLVTLLLFLK